MLDHPSAVWGRRPRRAAPRAVLTLGLEVLHSPVSAFENAACWLVIEYNRV